MAARDRSVINRREHDRSAAPAEGGNSQTIGPR
jgi:hypothetical protein